MTLEESTWEALDEYRQVLKKNPTQKSILRLAECELDKRIVAWKEELLREAYQIAR